MRKGRIIEIVECPEQDPEEEIFVIPQGIPIELPRPLEPAIPEPYEPAVPQPYEPKKVTR